MTKRKKSKRIPTGRLTTHELRRQIVALLKRRPTKSFNAKQIQKSLKIKNSKDSIQAALVLLKEREKVEEVKEEKFRILGGEGEVTVEKMQTVGIVDMTRHGAAYIVCDDLEDDIYVPAKWLNSALDGDKVEVEYMPPHKRKRRLEGRISNVLERASEYFIGTLHLSNRFGFVIPDKDNMFTDIYVALEHLNDAKDGEKVVVKIEQWPSAKMKSPTGIITDVLGKAGSSDIEMKSILIQNGFELNFPEEVIEEAEQLPETIHPSEIAQRRDFRNITTFTIDPDTAKDFDDALSIEYLSNGRVEVGVHIADVSHYVKEGSALDKEALKRSTSVYLVDRVLPMLPEKLSNVLCSLRPNEDKLTFSAVFTFGDDGRLLKEWFGKTIIHSDRRFTYEEAQTVIETGEGDFAKEILDLNKLAHQLRKKRFNEGSIDFDSPEVKFNLDEDGTPLSVYVKVRKEANLLIEDFMLLANKKVAEYIGKQKDTAPVPFVYRIHDMPDPFKIADFVKFASAIGYKINIQTPEQIAQAYNKLVKDAQEREELRVLEPLAIRTMAKAEYNTENIGHYGLGFDFYTHFTSPIRRYSDVLVHRILEKNLQSPYRVEKETLQTQCKHISAQERKAMDAERQSVKYKQVEYMTNHIGEVFEGVVSGFLERGFFVELLDNFCEGLVSFDNLEERYQLDESRLFALGKETGNKIRMGDRLHVRIIGANLGKRNIDMEFVHKNEVETA